jgi:O-antigen/teichoic acid export membrane protein
VSIQGHSIVTLAKQTVVYGLSGAALQLFGLVTLPVFARAFTPAQFGVIEIGTVTYSLLAVLTDAGLRSASQRNYFEYKADQPRERGAVLLTALLASVTIGAAIGIVLALVSGPLADALFKGTGEASVLVVVAITLPVSAAVAFTRESMRLHFRAWHYLISAVLSGGVAAAVSLVEVLALGSGVIGLFIGTLAGNAAAGLYGLVVARRSFGRGASRVELRSMLAYGLPLIIPGLSLWGLSFVDRYLLAGLSDLAQVGEYAVANRLAGVVLFIVTAFGTAFSPFIFSLYSEDREAETRVRARILNLLTLGLLAVSVAIGLYARELIMLIAPGFHSAYQSVGLLVLGTTDYGITTVVLFGISITRRTGWAAIYSTVAALLNVALNIALIPFSGQVGAAIATAAAFALLAVLYYRKSQQLYPTPYEPHRVIRAHLVAIPPLALGLIPLEPVALSIGVKAIAYVAFLVALRVTHAFSSEEFGYVVSYVRRLLPSRGAR